MWLSRSHLPSLIKYQEAKEKGMTKAIEEESHKSRSNVMNQDQLPTTIQDPTVRTLKENCTNQVMDEVINQDRIIIHSPMNKFL